MKTTLDIPDALYRLFKMKTAMNGETVRNATLAFIASYVNGRAVEPDRNGIPLRQDEKDADLELPAWAELAVPHIRKHLDGPHDMSQRVKGVRPRGNKGVVRQPGFYGFGRSQGVAGNAESR